MDIFQVGQQRQPTITRKGQFVQMPDLMKMPHGLPMSHAPFSIPNKTESQTARHALAEPVARCSLLLGQWHPAILELSRNQTGIV
jgi:hypothetical protein